MIGMIVKDLSFNYYKVLDKIIVSEEHKNPLSYNSITSYLVQNYKTNQITTLKPSNITDIMTEEHYISSILSKSKNLSDSV